MSRVPNPRRSFLTEAVVNGLTRFIAPQRRPQTHSQNVKYFTDSSDLGPWYKAFNNRRNQNHKPVLFASCFDEIGVCEAVRRAHQEGLKIITLGSLRVAPVTERLDSNQKYLVLHAPNSSVTWNGEWDLSVGPFCHTDELYRHLILRNRILPLGTGPTVKVGGYTLGGGIGILSREMGLMCDHLIRVRMVDGRGKVQDSQEDPALLWAARGGASELFGYFTLFQFRTQPLRLPLFQVTAQFGPEARFEALDWWFSFAENLPAGVHAALNFGVKSLRVEFVAFGTQQQAELDERFHENPSISRAFQTSCLESVTPHDFISGENLGGNFYEKSSLGFFDDPNEVRLALKNACAHLDEYESHLPMAGQNLVIRALGGEIPSPDRISQSAFPHRGFRFLAETNGFWYAPTKAAFCLEKLSLVKGLFGHLKSHYRNFQRNDLTHPGESYYGQNFERLVQLKKQFDPHGLFETPGISRAQET